MKKIFYVLLTVTLCACGAKNVTTDEEALSHEDSLLYNVFRAIGDSTWSCIDYKDSFYKLLDTMQTHVESYPDEDIRIGAKSLALEIVGLCFYGDFLSLEEQKFFIDSLVLRFSDVMSTWYSPFYASERDADWRQQPVMSQCVVFHSKDESDTNQYIYMDMYLTPDNKEVMIMTLPLEAEQLASIVFTDDATDLDNATTFNLSNSLNVLERTEEDGLSVLFGKDFIDAMLAHTGMFIGYVGEGETLEESYRSAHLLLTKFHEQYAHIKPLLYEK